MGIEILNTLSGGRFNEIELTDGQFCRPDFQSGFVKSQGIYTWMMRTSPGKSLFPWWHMGSSQMEAENYLKDFWGISKPQQLFDLLFLNLFLQLHRNNLYAIIPGKVKKNGWMTLKEEEMDGIRAGNNCVYTLEGSYSTALEINWVPFHQPQSVMAGLSLQSLWRYFAASSIQVEKTNCLTFFSLANTARFSQVMDILITDTSHRSRKLAKMADWFGMVSSPLSPDCAPLALFYSGRPVPFVQLESRFLSCYQKAQTDMFDAPNPQTALKILGRHIAF